MIELGQKLAQSQDAHNCFADHWLTYAYGRILDDGDECTRAAVHEAFLRAHGNVKELLLALTQTDAFMFRPTAGGSK